MAGSSPAKFYNPDPNPFCRLSCDIFKHYKLMFDLSYRVEIRPLFSLYAHNGHQRAKQDVYLLIVIYINGLHLLI
jgi:hypothetical protein